MKPLNVYAHVDMMSSHGRRIIKGIVRHNAAQSMPWVLRWGNAITAEQARGFDGVIASLGMPDVLREARRFSCPVVNISSVIREAWPYAVLPDNHRIGRMAAEFLSNRLYSELAVVGTEDHAYSIERHAGFLEALGIKNCRFSEGVGPKTPPEILQNFLRELPESAAVFAVNDTFGRQVVEACRMIGKVVPEDLAVIGVDVEEEQGISAGVALTSIDTDSEHIGLAVASMLDQFLRGETPSPAVIRIPPLRIVEQTSTSYSRSSDPHLQAALALIHSRSGIGLKVDDVVKVSGLGRRSLENRVKKATGLGIDTLMRRQRILRAEEWLRSTHLQIQEIADRCGYADLYYFSAAFKKETGLSPSSFRRNHSIL